MKIKQQLTLPCRLRELSEERKGQEVLTLKGVRSRGRHCTSERKYKRPKQEMSSSPLSQEKPLKKVSEKAPKI